MNKQDYYDILGVSRTADARELKRAYRRLAMAYHPDRNPDDQEAEVKFKATAEAYQILSDPDQRSLYDVFGHDGIQGRSRPSSAGFASVDDIFAQFNDMFGDIFDFPGAPKGSGPSKKSGAKKGVDLKTTLDISFEDAIFGTQAQVTFKRQDTCQSCEGSGASSTQECVPCERCAGQGEVRLSQGFFTVSTPCSLCGAKGYTVQEACLDCHGAGLKVEHVTKAIKIPPGVNDGARLRLPGQGNLSGATQERGDVLVTVAVGASHVFEREGLDLHYRARIPFVMAALGGQIEIPTLHVTQLLDLPPGTQFGDTHTLKGAGVTHTNQKSTGDILVHCVVEMPQALGKRQSELLRELARSMELDPEKPLPSAHAPLKTLPQEDEAS